MRSTILTIRSFKRSRLLVPVTITISVRYTKDRVVEKAAKKVAESSTSSASTAATPGSSAGVGTNTGGPIPPEMTSGAARSTGTPTTNSSSSDSSRPTPFSELKEDRFHEIKRDGNTNTPPNIESSSRVSGGGGGSFSRSARPQSPGVTVTKRHMSSSEYSDFKKSHPNINFGRVRKTGTGADNHYGVHSNVVPETSVYTTSPKNNAEIVSSINLIRDPDPNKFQYKIDHPAHFYLAPFTPNDISRIDYIKAEDVAVLRELQDRDSFLYQAAMRKFVIINNNPGLTREEKDQKCHEILFAISQQ